MGIKEQIEDKNEIKRGELLAVLYYSDSFWTAVTVFGDVFNDELETYVEHVYQTQVFHSKSWADLKTIPVGSVLDASRFRVGKKGKVIVIPGLPGEEEEEDSE